MSKKWIVAISIYLGLLTSCLVVLYAVPSIRGVLEKTYVAEFGELEVMDEVSAFIVRDEHVYVSKESSKINRLIGEGELVKAKSAVVELTPIEGDASSYDSGSYKDIIEELGKNKAVAEKGFSDESGYVCYSVDGAEGFLNTEKMRELTKEEYKALTDRKSKETPKNRCKKGEPVFKIIENSKWFLIFFTDKENGARYREGSYISMDVSGEPIRAKVYSVEELEKESRVTLECKSFFDGFSSKRRLDTNITIASSEGLILENESIVFRDGQEGVFVKNKRGEHVFKPIYVIARDRDKCVAYSDIYLDAEGNFVETIDTYDEIIARPDEEDLASIGINATKDDE